MAFQTNIVIRAGNNEGD